MLEEYILFYFYTIKYIGLNSDLISKNVTPCAPWSREDMNDAFIQHGIDI